MTAQAVKKSAQGLSVVGISQMIVSNDPSDILITYSLGSCVGVTIYDPIRKIGGLIHCMLPLSKIDREKAAKTPAMFVDTGVSAMLSEAYALGARREDLIVKVAGGAHSLNQSDRFRVGERNATVVRKLLWKNDLLLEKEDVGGTKPRTVTLHIATGQVLIRTGLEEVEL